MSEIPPNQLYAIHVTPQATSRRTVTKRKGNGVAYVKTNLTTQTNVERKRTMLTEYQTIVRIIRLRLKQVTKNRALRKLRLQKSVKLTIEPCLMVGIVINNAFV